MRLGNRALLTISKPDGMDGINAKTLDSEFIFLTESEINQSEYKEVLEYCRKANLSKDFAIYVAHVEQCFSDIALDEELDRRNRKIDYGHTGFTFKGSAIKEGKPVGIFHFYSGQNGLDPVMNRSLRELMSKKNK